MGYLNFVVRSRQFSLFAPDFVCGVVNTLDEVSQGVSSYVRELFKNKKNGTSTEIPLRVSLETLEESERTKNISRLFFLFSISAVCQNCSFSSLIYKIAPSSLHKYLTVERPAISVGENWELLRKSHKEQLDQGTLFSEFKKLSIYKKADFLGKVSAYFCFFVLYYVLDSDNLASQLQGNLRAAAHSYDSFLQKKWEKAIQKIAAAFSRSSKQLLEEYIKKPQKEEVLELQDFNNYLKTPRKINGKELHELYASFFEVYLASYIPKASFFRSQIASCSPEKATWLSLPFYYLFSCFDSIFQIPVNFVIRRLVFLLAPNLLDSSIKTFIHKTQTPGISASLFTFLKNLTEKLKNRNLPRSPGTMEDDKTYQMIGEELLAVFKALSEKTPEEMKKTTEKDLSTILLPSLLNPLLCLDKKIGTSLGEVVFNSIKASTSTENVALLVETLFKAFDGQFQEGGKSSEELEEESIKAQKAVLENLKTLYENIIESQLEQIIKDPSLDGREVLLPKKWEELQREFSLNGPSSTINALVSTLARSFSSPEIENSPLSIQIRQLALVKEIKALIQAFQKKIEEESLTKAVKQIFEKELEIFLEEIENIEALFISLKEENSLMSKCLSSLAIIQPFLEEENLSYESLPVERLLKLEERREASLFATKIEELENKLSDLYLRLKEEEDFFSKLQKNAQNRERSAPSLEEALEDSRLQVNQYREKITKTSLQIKKYKQANNIPQNLNQLKIKLLQKQRDYTASLEILREKEKQQEKLDLSLKESEALTEGLNKEKEDKKRALETSYIAKVLQALPLVGNSLADLERRLLQEDQRITSLRSEIGALRGEISLLQKQKEEQEDSFFNALLKYKKMLHPGTGDSSSLARIEEASFFTLYELTKESIENTKEAFRQKLQAFIDMLTEKEAPPPMTTISSATPSGFMIILTALFLGLGFSAFSAVSLALLCFTVQNPKPVASASVDALDVTNKASSFTVERLTQFLKLNGLTNILVHVTLDSLHELGPDFWKRNS